MTGVVNDLPPGFGEPYHLGSGAWAAVFRCVDASDGQQVAVKLFHRYLDDPIADAVEFHNECRTAAALSGHPGVITIRAAGVAASRRPWLAMDLATGGTVADLIKKHGGRLPLDTALAVTVAVADTMSWVHGRASHTIHGDLKPANILLDDTGRPLLSDFGVASHLGSRNSVTVAQFTQTHAAPEVLRDGRGSVSSDIWSLTATLFEMLTGAAPFVVKPSEGAGAFIDRVQRGLPADAIPASVPAVVAEQIRAGLAVDRNDRPASMTAFATGLRAAQRSLGPSITPPWPAAGPPTELRFSSYTDAISLTIARPNPDGPRPARIKPDGPRPAHARQDGPRWRIPAIIAAVVAVILATAGIGIALNRRPAAQAQGTPTSAVPASGTPTAGPTPVSTPSTPGGQTSTGPGAGSGGGPQPSKGNPPPAAPGVITSFSVLDHEGVTGLDRRLSFSVTPPASALPINRYEFDYTGDGAADVTSSATQGYLTDLTNGTDYTVRVRACASSCGAWSAGATQRPYGPVATPGAGASKSGAAQILLSWGVPGTNGRPLSQMQIRVDGGGWENVGVGNGSRVVGNGPSQTHTIEVRAFDSAGQTSASASAGATTDPSRVVPSPGGNAQGQPGCSSSACRFIVVTLVNFPPNTQVTCTFNSSLGSGGFVQYKPTTNGSGNFSGQSGNYFGVASGWVTVTCNGISGTRNPWAP